MHRRWLGFGIGGFVLAGVAFAFVWSRVPRIGHATEAEILALVPPEFREPPPRAPEAEARLDALIAADEVPTPERFRRLSSILDAGPLRVRPRESQWLRERRGYTFEAFGEDFKRRIVWAARLDDPTTCGATILLGVRLIDAFERAGGGAGDMTAASKLLGVIADATAEADRLGGLFPTDRDRLLKLLPEEDGRSETMARAVATDFRLDILPLLLRAAHGEGGLINAWQAASFNHPTNPGTYDPLATTRLFVDYARADQKVCREGRQALDPALVRRARSMRGDLPQPPIPPVKPLDRFRYRWAANNGRNTLGRAWAIPARIDRVGALAAERAYRRNRFRQALLKGQ